ncbi:MAG: glycoside hydrolase family 36 protein [Chloroflexota bacterium]
MSPATGVVRLESRALQFELDVGAARWSLRPRGEGLSIVGARMRVDYSRGGQRLSALERWQGAELSGPETQASSYGPMNVLELALAPEASGVRLCLEFALPEAHSLFLWRLSLENGGVEPVYPERLSLLEAGQPYTPNSSIGNHTSKILNPVFFSNGWQSWTYSAAYGEYERMRRSRLGFLTAPMRHNAGSPRPRQRGHFASEMFGVLGDRSLRLALLAGFLSQQQHFGSLEAWLPSPGPALRLWANGDGARLDPGEKIVTDWACLSFLDVDAPDPLGPYLQAVALGHQLPPVAFQQASIPVGWCSWYQFYQKVTADDIRRNLHALAEQRASLPVEVVQIDDGFQTLVGDWFTFRGGFPGGPAPLAAEIHAAGYTPGLWLAPFIVQPNSRLAAEHPEWLLRGQFNRPVRAGFIWNTFTTALDLTHPEALDYACQVVDTAAHAWGFPYLKLDFLYAAALPGRYRDPSRTRAQVLRAGLQALRQAAGEDTFLLGCGCPLGSAIGLVEAMRIGTDVDSHWRAAFMGHETYFHVEPDLPSARNAIQNSLTRAALHRRWWLNDPDCLLLRPDLRLSLAEVHSLATVIALSGGLVLFSDDLPRLTPERLRIAWQMLPPIGERPQVVDWLDALTPRRLRLDLDGASGPWRLLALFNWDERPQDCTLHLADYGLEADAPYLAREFWSGAIEIASAKLEFKGVEPHGVRLVALRRCLPGMPGYLGSDLHISQGLEVLEWQPSAGGVSLRLARPGQAQGVVDLYLPGSPKTASLAGRPLTWEKLAPDCYRLYLDFEGEASLRIVF